jgi:predicted ABC-type ATPase
MSQPVLTVIAGANGAGKSTLTKWAKDFFQLDANLDADAASVDLQARESGPASRIEAGKEVLHAARELLSKNVSFSVETTLSGTTYLRMLADARQRGYRTRLLYIGTQNLSINIARVQARVLKGGHDVPLEDQKRRYGRSLANLPKALSLADEAVLLDNSSDGGHRIVAMKREGESLRFFSEPPSWATSLRG